MKYDVISTGSSGNCIIINDWLMLDCGIPYVKIKDKIKKIKLIFIGHIHSDHFKKSTIKKIAYEKPNIKFLVGYFLAGELVQCGVQKKNIIILEPSKWYNIGVMKAKFDYLYHDVPNNALHFQLNSGEKCFYATDTNKVDHIVAKEYDYYFIEANYDTDDALLKEIEKAHEMGEYTHLERVINTHLSQLQALNWLDNNQKDSSNVIFIHQHIEKGEKNDI